ncbi:hypothetical protein [Rhizobium leguminosarum]|uniref:hypothetical protein n=1 Tax=Rhizobium leguminosarum TaxID=384 RepID=UPI003F988D67
MAAYQILKSSEAQHIADMVNRALIRLGISLNNLAARAGVSQSMAHGALRGKLKRRTPNVRRLELYIHITLGEREATDLRALDEDIMSYLAAGGDVVALRAHIKALAQVQRTLAVGQVGERHI